MLSPEDIVRKEFREAFRGYNQSDVDLFLDEIVEEMTRIVDESRRLKARVAALQQELGRVRSGAPVAPEAGGDDARRPVEAEVRGRLRRFFEEQIRALDEASPTIERIRRELPADPPTEPTQRLPWNESGRPSSGGPTLGRT